MVVDEVREMATSDPSLLQKIVDILWKRLPGRVLDVGCGFGKVGFLTREYLDVYLHRNYHKGEWTTIVDGIEVWPDFITDVHRHLYDSVHIGDATKVMPGLGRYDVIFILDVIEHLSKEDGCRLLDLARKHGRHVVVSTPASHIDQGAILGNPHECHVSDWTAEELGGTVEVVGPLLVAEIDGVSSGAVHLITEGHPGWALRHLTMDIADFLRRNGRNVAPPYDWANGDDIAKVKALSQEDPSSRFYVSTAPAAEIIHRSWGIPREHMYFLLHSVDDILEFRKRFLGEEPPTLVERAEFLASVGSIERDDVLIDAFSRYAAVGYLSLEQGDLLRRIGVDGAFHVPQYVDVDRFKFADRESRSGPLVVGAALTTVSHPVRKGVTLLSEIVGMIRKRDDMVFDPRAIRGPMGARGLPYDAMPGYLDGIDVMLCTASSEGGPLPPLQAAACGVPTVSTRCGHMPEFVACGHTGFLVEPDADSFMERLDTLASDRGLLARMGRNARSNIDGSWTIDANGHRWIDMLEGLR